MEIKNTVQERLFFGDENALAELYHIYYKKLIDFASCIVHSGHIAEEAVDDVFIRLWRNRNSAHEIKNLAVYLYSAVKNASLNALSKKSRQLVSASFGFLNIDVEDEMNAPDDLMITAEMMLQMQRAVETLPPRCKMIFKLIREDGLKYKEVAEILNISVNTIDAQMAIAVKKLCMVLQIEKPLRSFQYLS